MRTIPAIPVRENRDGTYPKKQSTMKRKDTTTLRYLLLILAAAILNCLLDGTMNLIVTVCLCLALVPAARRMDREAQKKQ